MDKVIDANDVFKIIKKLRNVIPSLFKKQNEEGTTYCISNANANVKRYDIVDNKKYITHCISNVIRYDIDNNKYISNVIRYDIDKKYKDLEQYKDLNTKYAAAKDKLKNAEYNLKNAEDNLNNDEQIKVASDAFNVASDAFKKFYTNYENTFCLGDSIMKSLYSTDTELSKLESEWRTLSDLKVFKCIIYLLFYYANMYDDAYNSNRCWGWDKENWQINEIDKIIIFKSFLQSCIDYIDTQSVEIPNFTDDEFALIKQAVINKNEKCKLKDYFNTLPYIDKLCFYILDRNAVSSANQGNNGALCPFIGFKKKASLGKRFSKKLISIGQSIASLTGANKQKIINTYEIIIGDVFDTYVQNYNKIKSMTPNYRWRTPETKWAPLADTNNCKNLFITKFKKSQDDMEFLCYCLLLQKYIESMKELMPPNDLESNKPVQDELTKYINTAIAALRVKNTKINKYIKCNDYNTNLPETGKYIVDVILLEDNLHKNGGKRFTRKNKKVLQRRRVK